LAQFKRAADGPAYEEAAEDEEDNHGLMTRGGKNVRNGKKHAMQAKLVKVDEEVIAAVICQNQNRRQSS
jgi:hypothetical protein